MPGRAAADIIDLTGGDAAGIARANPVALGPGAALAITGNPALLARTPGGTVGSVIVSGSQLDINLRARPAGAEVPDSIYTARLADGSAVGHYLATSDLVNAPTGGTIGTEVGVLAAATSKLGHGLGAGWLAYVPLSGATQNTYYADEREAPFSNSVRPALVEDDHGSMTFAGAGAFTPRPWLSAGLGLKLLIGARSATMAYVPDALDSSTARFDMETKISPSIVPLAGVVVQPGHGLSVGLSGRPSHSQSTSGGSDIQLWADKEASGSTSAQTINMVYDWQPARLALAAGWAQGDTDLTIEAVYRDWSEYLDQHGEHPAPGFDDTVDLGISGGARSGTWEFSGGLRYVPSPVPPQTGRSNYADSDRYILAAGGTHRGCLLGRPVEFAFGVQLQGFEQRWFDKGAGSENPVIDEFPDAIAIDGSLIEESQGLQTNNPGYPGFGIEGWLWNVGVSLTLTD